MIQTFPDLYPDELMYSGYARYTLNTGYPDLKNVVNELFGSRQIIASVSFSSHLDYFVAHQPYLDRFTTESLIAEHTLLSFYAPFLPPQRVQQLQMDMRGTNGPGIYSRIGLMASIVPSPQYLQYCPECTRADQIHFGEVYWHRHHQIPGVLVCHIHDTWLEQSNVLIHSRKTRHQFIAAEAALQPLPPSQAIDSSSRLCDTLLFLANGAEWLLQQRDLSPGLEFLHAAYKQALISRELATYTGRVRMAELQEAFVSYYPEDVLSYLHCNLNRYSSDNWLARLVRKPDGSQHPLQHLLLMRFLDLTIETFFSSSSSDLHPFGTGPWPCLNAASDHYHQHQITECKITHSPYTNGRPVGTFSCPCGFVYSRTGPDVSIEDLFRFNKIKAFGQSWEMRLQTLWEDESVSLRGIARQLGIDPLTVKRHASRLGVPFPRSRGTCSKLSESRQLQPHVLKMPKASVLETRRTAWLTLLQVNPKASVTKLRSISPGIYTWLYRHDKIWLKEHMPRLARKNKPGNYRVDWTERDVQLAKEVRVAAVHLKNLPGRPTHISITAIGREIGRVALLQQHLDKLPQTAEILKEHVESREAYAIRRVWWVAMDCIEKNISLSWWQLIRKAGVSHLAKHPQIKKAIEIIWEEIDDYKAIEDRLESLKRKIPQTSID